MINKFKALIQKVVSGQEAETQTTILQKKAGTFNVECAIDEEVVDCNEMDSPPYIGVPAPAYLEDDPWFGMAPTPTEKQQDYMVQEAEIKMVEEQQRSEETCESEDIHAKMYEIATQNWTTVAETQGGSENFQEGPGGWNSGTGINQFQR
jgi:hypothetical protein